MDCQGHPDSNNILIIRIGQAVTEILDVEYLSTLQIQYLQDADQLATGLHPADRRPPKQREMKNSEQFDNSDII